MMKSSLRTLWVLSSLAALAACGGGGGGDSTSTVAAAPSTGSASSTSPNSAPAPAPANPPTVDGSTPPAPPPAPTPAPPAGTPAPSPAPAPTPAPDRATIRGTDGDDTLRNDTGSPQVLAGGRGNDVYRLAFPTDEVIEREGEGIDEVSVGTPYRMPPHVERLTSWAGFLSDGYGNQVYGDASYFIGNSLDNYMSTPVFAYVRVFGMEGNDYMCGCGRAGGYLDGGPGNDTFVNNNAGESVGGPGADTFFGGSRQNPNTPSKILDFNGPEGDRIVVGSRPGATTAEEQFEQGYLIWNSETRTLTSTSTPFQTDRLTFADQNFELRNLSVQRFDPAWIRVGPSEPAGSVSSSTAAR